MITDTKTCSNCRQPKPTVDFYKDPRSSDQFKSKCKPCYLISSSAYYVAVARKRNSTPTRRKLKNAQNRAARIRKFGEWKRGQRRHERWLAQQQSRLPEIQRKFTDRLRLKYGDDVALEYSKNPFKPYSSNGLSRTELRELFRTVIKRKTGILANDSMLARIRRLNKVSGLPLLSIGWHCFGCGIVHADPRFFEIDHVTPRADGGSNHPTNLQCLCPNCHKRKTLSIDGFTMRQSFKTAIRVEVNEISSVATAPQTQTDSLIKQSDQEPPPAADVQIVTAEPILGGIPASALQLKFL